MEEDYKLAKWLNDELSDKELQDLEKDSDFELLEKIKKESTLLKTRNFNEEKMLSEILVVKDQSKVLSLKSSNWIFKVAASLALVAGLLFTFYKLNSETIIASEKMAILLPDESEVILNKNASIEYNSWFWNFNRKLELNGEAYFKVKKGEKFQVQTNYGTVTVLGTQFNVKAENQIFEVTCYEGKVKVETKNNTNILTRGMAIALENNKIKESSTLFTEPKWNNPNFVIEFNNSSFKDIILSLEESYGVSINTKFDTNQSFTGKIPSNNLNVALEIIASTYHLQILTKNSTEYELIVK